MKNYSVTLSAGIVEYPSDTSTAKEIIPLADKALYLAKKDGRNQIILASTIIND